jgi:teichuronic acid biosynthesis protein TuaE
MTKRIAYAVVMASLIGASVISLDMKIFQLSLFRVLIILLSFVSIAKILMTDTGIGIDNKKRSSYSIRFMLIWLTYSIFTIAWVKDDVAWFKAVYFIGIGVICVLLFKSIFRDTVDIVNAFRAMSIMVLVHNSIGLLEVFTGRYLFYRGDHYAEYASHKNPVTMFSNTNDFATLMAMSVFILYICFANSKHIIAKIIYTGIAASSVFLLLMTSSRANILGLVLALTTFVFLSVKSSKNRKQFMVLAIIFFCFVLFTPQFYEIAGRVVKVILNFNFNTEGGSEFIRVNLILNGFRFLTDTFGFGTGAGNIEYWMTNHSFFNTYGITNMHNWWMEILTGYGVIIFALYIVFFFRMLRDVLEIHRTSDRMREKTVAIGIFCCIITFTVSSVSSSSIIPAEWLWVFWAIAIAFQGNYDKRTN